jgi:hypothetical protein
MRTLIYNKDGAEAIEINARVSSVTYGMNGDVTTTSLHIPITDSKINKDLITVGNIVVIEDENLPAWGGVLWTPISWGRDALTLEVKSPEFYLEHRVTKREYDPSMLIGSVVRGMIRRSNKDAPLPFVVTNIDTGGQVGGDDSIKKGEFILDVIQSLQEAHPFEWWIETERRGTKPMFNLYLQPRRQTIGLPIEIGANGNADWATNGMVETGDPISQYVAFTKDAEFAIGAASQFKVNTLFDRHGLWESSVQVEQIPSGGGRPEEVKAAIQQNKINRGFHIQAFLGSLTKSMRPGSVHLLSAPDLGVSAGQRGVNTVVRVDQMSFSSDNGYLEVVAFEYEGTEIKEFIK